jgi:hypothetical protein
MRATAYKTPGYYQKQNTQGKLPCSLAPFTDPFTHGAIPPIFTPCNTQTSANLLKSSPQNI